MFYNNTTCRNSSKGEELKRYQVCTLLIHTVPFSAHRVHLWMRSALQTEAGDKWLNL